MKALCVLYGGDLAEEAFEKAFSGSSAFSLALEAAGKFPGAEKTVLLGVEGKAYPGLPSGTPAVLRPSWTRKSLLEEISRLSSGCDFAYTAWADCPFLDARLAGALAERHIRYGAEYSYADGWPYGFAPELLGSETAGILAKMAEDADGPVERDTLFAVLQKDINAFNIETEISPVDLRQLRLCLAADSKRNLLLLSRLAAAGLSSAADAETLLEEKPGLLRTLPAFFNIQVSAACPQTCSCCPWPEYGAGSGFMPAAAFAGLLDNIAAFAGDAVIDISLWGELSLHPQKRELINAVLARPELSLVVETSGVGWTAEDFDAAALAASRAAPRKNRMAPLSWIVSLDAHDPERYRKIRGPGFSEAVSCARTLLSLFPGDAYVQALRVKDSEDDIELFYRSWKGEGRKDGGHIIIQKYDDFAGALPKMRAADLSPVRRRPCWHITRDMNILLDGRVPRCREDLAALKGGGAVWGSAFSDDLSSIWEKGNSLYTEHCNADYKGICADCDEYYTFNF